MLLDSTVSHSPEAFPGVTFVVRKLNVIQRARRDAAIAEKRLEHNRLILEQRRLHRELKIGAFAEGSGIDAYDRLSQADQERCFKLSERINTLLYADILPAAIRAGLVSISGVKIDGEDATIDKLIECGDDTLLETIYLACEEAAGLTGDQQKNSPSPGTSAGQEGSAKTNGIAPIASELAITGAETAAAISPTT